MRDGADPSETKVLRAHAPPQGSNDYPTCALKLLADLLNGGGNLVDTIFEGVREQSRLKITIERRRFIDVDKIRGGEDWRFGETLGGDQGGQAQVQQNDFPECGHPVRSGRVGTSSGRGGDGTQFVMPTCKGVEGWENLYSKFVEMNKEIHIRSPWKLQGKNDLRNELGQTNEKKRERRKEVRQELLGEHVSSGVCGAAKSGRELFNGWREQLSGETPFCRVVSPCGRRAWFSHRVLSAELAPPGGACMFDCFIVC